MNQILSRIKAEPALVTGAVLALIGVLSSLGLGITDGQRDAIVALVGAALALIGAGVTRHKVTPVAPREYVNGQAEPDPFDVEHPRDPQTGRFIED